MGIIIGIPIDMGVLIPWDSLVFSVGIGTEIQFSWQPVICWRVELRDPLQRIQQRGGCRKIGE